MQDADGPPGAARVSRRTSTALALGCVFNPLNSSMIAVALVSLHQAFTVSLATTAWLVAGFYLAASVAQPVVGELADRFGARRTYCAGVAAVGLAGLVAITGPPFEVLVACRVVQAVGASASYPAALIVLRRLSGDGTPTRSLGVLSATQTASAALGPVLGGFLVSTAGWQGIFAVNVPLSVLALAAALRWLPSDDPRRPVGSPHRPVDVRGIIAHRGLLGVLAQQFLAQATFYLAYLGLPIWWENTRGLPASQIGLLLVPLAALGLVATPLAARVVERAGPGPVLGGAALLTLAAEAGLLGVHAATPVPVVLLLTGMLGVAMAFINISLQTGLYRAAGDRLGAAGGLFQTSRYLGAIAASALATSVLGSHSAGGGLHRIAWAGVVMTVVLLVVAGLVAHRARGRPAYGAESSSVR